MRWKREPWEQLKVGWQILCNSFLNALYIKGEIDLKTRNIEISKSEFETKSQAAHLRAGLNLKAEKGSR